MSNLWDAPDTGAQAPNTELRATSNGAAPQNDLFAPPSAKDTIRIESTNLTPQSKLKTEELHNAITDDYSTRQGTVPISEAFQKIGSGIGDAATMIGKRIASINPSEIPIPTWSEVKGAGKDLADYASGITAKGLKQGLTVDTPAHLAELLATVGKYTGANTEGDAQRMSNIIQQQGSAFDKANPQDASGRQLGGMALPAIASLAGGAGLLRNVAAGATAGALSGGPNIEGNTGAMAALQGAGGLGGAATGAAKESLVGGPEAVLARLAQAKDQGIKLTVGQATQSPSLMKFEKMLSDATYGTGGTFHTQNEQLQKLANNLVDAKQITNEDLSQAILARGKQTISNMDTADQKAWKNWVDQASTVQQPVPLLETNKVIQGMKSDLSKTSGAYDPDVQNKMNSMLQFNDDFITKNGGQISPIDAHTRMSALGKASASGDPGTSQIAYKLKDALHQDLASFSDMTGNPDLIKSLDDAIAFHRDIYIPFQKDPAIKTIDKLNAGDSRVDTLLDQFVKKGQPTRLSKLGLDPDTAAQVDKQTIGDAYNKAFSTDGTWNAKKFSKALDDTPLAPATQAKLNGWANLMQTIQPKTGAEAAGFWSTLGHGLFQGGDVLKSGMSLTTALPVKLLTGALTSSTTVPLLIKAAQMNPGTLAAHKVLNTLILKSLSEKQPEDTK